MQVTEASVGPGPPPPVGTVRVPQAVHSYSISQNGIYTARSFKTLMSLLKCFQTD